MLSNTRDASVAAALTIAELALAVVVDALYVFLDVAWVREHLQFLGLLLLGFVANAVVTSLCIRYLHLKARYRAVGQVHARFFLLALFRDDSEVVSLGWRQRCRALIKGLVSSHHIRQNGLARRYLSQVVSFFSIFLLESSRAQQN